MDQEYLDNVTRALGRIIGNLWSLEWMVRNVLYLQGHPPHTPMPRQRLVLTAQVGATFPENALTSYASLAPLLRAFNQTSRIPIDLDLVTLRDTIAHGRVVAGNDEVDHLSLVKFHPPDASRTILVAVRYDLTLQWMDEQIARVGKALDVAIARYKELGGQ
jgi:hypothetical protein